MAKFFWLFREASIKGFFVYFANPIYESPVLGKFFFAKNLRPLLRAPFIHYK